jgi:hypothetical protein
VERDYQPIYAILAATDTAPTLHAHARDRCDRFAEQTRLLAADGLLDADTDDLKPPNAVDAKTLARRVSVDAKQLRWADATVYVLAEPERLDHETGDPFRRSLRVVFERLSADVVFPYDDLEEAECGTWLVECLDEGEMLHPGNNYSRNKGLTPTSAASIPSKHSKKSDR